VNGRTAGLARWVDRWSGGCGPARSGQGAQKPGARLACRLVGL